MAKKKTKTELKEVEKIIEEVIELKEEVAEVQSDIEEIIADVKEIEPELYAIANSNRLRIRLEEGTLDGSCFDGVEIENMDVRSVPFTGCLLKDTVFKNVIFQGCNMGKTLGISGCTFIDCDMRWGVKPPEFETNNKFVNTRL